MRKRTKLEPLSERAENRLIRWAGYVWRMDENNLVRKVKKWAKKIDREKKTRTPEAKMER
jgi:hypothetical protein